jgi:hypothetical protein
MPGCRTGRSFGVSLTASLALLLALSTDAAAQAFTTRAAFNAALPGAGSTNGFDTVTAGTTVASGGSAAGVTFTYNFGGTLLKVTSAYPAVSGANALGTADADIFQDGDNLALSFPATNALGLNIITKETLQNGDLSLSAGGSTASIASIQIQQTLSDGSNVYFLGVVNATTAFTTATLSTVGGGYFFYNLDDFTTARAQDTDHDGISDTADNCTQVANGNLVLDAGGHSQLDTNGDGYGNACDADLDNNGIVNFADLALFRAAFGTTNANADLNGSGGVVNFADLAIFRGLFGRPPGPSGLHPP